MHLLLPSVLVVALGCTNSAPKGSGSDVDGGLIVPDVASGNTSEGDTSVQDSIRDNAVDAVGGDAQLVREAGTDGREDIPPDVLDARLSACSDLQASGPVLRDISNISSPAGGYNGGTIVDGTYELIDILEYPGPSGAMGIVYGTKQRTIRISNNATRIELLWVSVPAQSMPSPATTNASGTISLAPPMMTITLTCGVNASFSYYYTVVSESELVLYFWDATNTGETVFTYQRKTSGSSDGGLTGDSGRGSG